MQERVAVLRVTRRWVKLRVLRLRRLRGLRLAALAVVLAALLRRWVAVMRVALRRRRGARLRRARVSRRRRARLRLILRLNRLGPRACLPGGALRRVRRRTCSLSVPYGVATYSGWWCSSAGALRWLRRTVGGILAPWMSVSRRRACGGSSTFLQRRRTFGWSTPRRTSIATTRSRLLGIARTRGLRALGCGLNKCLRLVHGLKRLGVGGRAARASTSSLSLPSSCSTLATRTAAASLTICWPGPVQRTARIVGSPTLASPTTCFAIRRTAFSNARGLSARARWRVLSPLLIALLPPRSAWRMS